MAQTHDTTRCHVPACILCEQARPLPSWARTAAQVGVLIAGALVPYVGGLIAVWPR